MVYSQVMLAKRTTAYLRLASTSIAVGLAVAIAVKLFKGMVHQVSAIFYGGTGFAAPDLINHSYIAEHPYILGLPAVGGLIVGLFLQKTQQKYGVPETIASAVKKDGVIPSNAGPHTAVANSLSLGSGTSAGSEGPLVQVGSAIGSAIGKVCGLSGRSRVSILAAGGAASFAVLFGAPLAGMFFAMEVILRAFRLRDVVWLAIAAFTAVVSSGGLGGQVLSTNAPSWDNIATANLIIPAVALAAACALAGSAFVRITHFVTRRTQRLEVPLWFCTAIGGLLVGAIAWFFPQVLGIGEATLGTLLASENTSGLLLLIGLALAKIVATGITLGSGVPGGCLFPSLFIGAATGSALGEGLHTVLPNVSTIFALVGAASVLAVVVRAPLAAILLVISVAPSIPLAAITIVTVVAAMGISRCLGGISMYDPALAAQAVAYGSAYARPRLFIRRAVRYPKIVSTED